MSRMFKTAELGVWEPVPDFPDYIVSKDGQVLSVKRGYGWILSPIKRKRSGHLYVFLYRDGQMFKKYIHNLVLIAWNRQPLPGEEGRHLNGNPADNHLDNLAWGTPQDNSDDRVRHGRSPRGEKSPVHKLTEQQVFQIRQRVGRETLRSLAKEYGVSHTCIRRAGNGMNWGYL
jgi:hypothetical protein